MYIRQTPSRVSLRSMIPYYIRSSSLYTVLQVTLYTPYLCTYNVPIRIHTYIMGFCSTKSFCIGRVSLSSGQQRTTDSTGRARETVRLGGKKGASLFSSRYVYGGGEHVYSINHSEENGTTTVEPINPADIRCRPSPRVLRNTSHPT